MAKSLRQAAKTFNTSRWDEAIKDDLFQIPQKPARSRLYDHIVTVKQHFVEFYSEKKKSNTGFYELCLNWDPVKDEEVASGGCPMCANGMQPTAHHYAYLIVRRKDTKPGQAPTVSPVRLTGKMTSNILKLSSMVFIDGNPEGWDGEDPPDATDQKFGFDVYLSKEDNKGKTDYIAQSNGTDLSPLSKVERAAFAEYISDGHDVAQLAKAGMRPRQEILTKLVSLKVIKGGAAAPSKGNYDDLDGDDDKQEQVPDDEDPASPPPKTAKKPTKPAPVEEDDDDNEPPAKTVKVEKRRSLPWDEEDGDDAPPPATTKKGGASRTVATPDEDDAPSDESED